MQFRVTYTKEELEEKRKEEEFWRKVEEEGFPESDFDYPTFVRPPGWTRFSRGVKYSRPKDESKKCNIIYFQDFLARKNKIYPTH